VALDIHQTTHTHRARVGESTTRPLRRGHLVLAMATGLFAIGVGVWRWAPDYDPPSDQSTVTTVVSARGTP
jgi:hypothetical protein